MPEDYRQLREAIEAAGLGHWRFDPETGELHSSERCKRNFGRDPAEEFTYEDLIASIHPEDRAGMQEAVRRALNREEDYEAEYRCIWPCGEVRRVLAHGRLVEAPEEASNGHARLVGTTRDTTERKRAEEAVQASEEKYHTLFDSIDEGFCVVEMIFDEEGKPVDYRFVETNPAFGRQTGLEDALGKTMRELQPEHEEHWFEIYGRVALTGEPVRFENPAGMLHRYFEVYAFRYGEPEERQVAILFKDITERKRPEEVLRESEERQAFVLRVSDALRPLADPVDIQQTLTRTAMDYFQADRCYYCEIEGGDAIIRCDACREDLPSVAGVYPLDGFPLFKAVVDAGHPFVVDNVRTTDAVDEELRRLCIELQVISYVDVPVIKDGEPVGILCLVQTTPRDWTDLEVELAVETAERTWAAVERARAEAERDRIEAEREQTRQRTAFLSEASRRLAESLDWQQTLSEIARLAVPSICDLCIVDTLGAPGEAESVRRLAAAHHDPEKERLAWELEEHYPVSEDPKSAVAEVIRTAEPVLLTEVTEDWLQYVSQDEGQRQILEELELSSMIIVPLAIHGHTFGALTLAYDGSGRRYDEEDLTLASDLGRRAAQAMDNARLYEEQSHAARILQQSLLPPSLPEIPGVQTAVRFKPAASAGGRATGGYDVGGDFYDLFQTPTGWAAVVGDVAGKGVEAAQLTSMARYTLRASAMDGESPSNTVSKLNAAMLNQRSDSKFCTLAYGLLNHFDGDSHDGDSHDSDSHDGGAAGRVRLRLCRGGHPPPLILRANGSVEEAGVRGKLVGAIPDARFEDLAVDLDPNDAVVFYTDGVTESRNPEGELFGDERLKELTCTCTGLDAEEIADALEDSIVEFQNGADARDDVALLVLKTTARQ